jgi:hypothetical protein
LRTCDWYLLGAAGAGPAGCCGSVMDLWLGTSDRDVTIRCPLGVVAECAACLVEKRGGAIAELAYLGNGRRAWSLGMMWRTQWREGGFRGKLT